MENSKIKKGVKSQNWWLLKGASTGISAKKWEELVWALGLIETSYKDVLSQNLTVKSSENPEKYFLDE